MILNAYRLCCSQKVLASLESETNDIESINKNINSKTENANENVSKTSAVDRIEDTNDTQIDIDKKENMENLCSKAENTNKEKNLSYENYSSKNQFQNLVKNLIAHNSKLSSVNLENIGNKEILKKIDEVRENNEKIVRNTDLILRSKERKRGGFSKTGCGVFIVSLVYFIILISQLFSIGFPFPLIQKEKEKQSKNTKADISFKNPENKDLQDFTSPLYVAVKTHMTKIHNLHNPEDIDRICLDRGYKLEDNCDCSNHHSCHHNLQDNYTNRAIRGLKSNVFTYL